MSILPGHRRGANVDSSVDRLTPHACLETNWLIRIGPKLGAKAEPVAEKDEVACLRMTAQSNGRCGIGGDAIAVQADEQELRDQMQYSVSNQVVQTARKSVIISLPQTESQDGQTNFA